MILRLSSYFSSTTLSILNRNKRLLKFINKSSDVTQQQSASLSPLPTMQEQYTLSSHIKEQEQYKELEGLRGKLRPNQALSSGSDIESYSLPKVMHICLQKLTEHPGTSDQMWNQLEQRVEHLFRNTSISDNILLAYIAFNQSRPFSEQLQNKILTQIEQELKYLSDFEKQLLFYALCQFKTNQAQLNSSRINNLKHTLMSSAVKMRMQMSSLASWFILIAVTNASQFSIVRPIADKLCSKTTKCLDIDQLLSLLLCLEYRSSFSNQLINDHFSDWTQKLLASHAQLIEEQLSNVANKQGGRLTKLKMIISYNQPSAQTLTNEQIIKGDLTVFQSLKYLYWLWKNDLRQQYELRSLYESLDISKSLAGAKFECIGIIFYCCFLEMAFGQFYNVRKIKDWVELIEYVPRGLEWPLWNYSRNCQKNKNEDIRIQLLKILADRLQATRQNFNKEHVLKQELQMVNKNQGISEIQKFLRAVRLFNFEEKQFLKPIDRLAHFVDSETKVVLHCLEQRDFVFGSNKVLNSQFLLNQVLLKQNFGYGLVPINVPEFLNLSYNERVATLMRSVKRASCANDKVVLLQ